MSNVEFSCFLVFVGFFSAAIRQILQWNSVFHNVGVLIMLMLNEKASEFLQDGIDSPVLKPSLS